MSNNPIPYPRRLYLHGEVIEGDLHATNSVVVQGPGEEEEARARGYRKAWEPAEDDGGNGGSTAHRGLLADDQGGVAPASATPEVDAEPAEPDAIEALRAKLEAAGVKVDRRWKESRLADELAKVAP